MKKHEHTAPHQPAETTAQRKRLFLAVTISIPILFFIAVELILRWAHYGPNLELFTTEEISGKIYHTVNPDVKQRYFTRTQFSPNVAPDYFLVPKVQGTYRIFCLGGSTTIGFPYGFAGSFASFLNDRLRRTFPDKNIEVINLGMTATNSFTVLDMAREVVRYEPDLIIVYDGHNEFYGALGIASNESVGGSRFLTQAYLSLIHSRTFLLLRSALLTVKSLLSSSIQPVESGTMMERLSRGQYVPYNSSLYRKGLSIFKDNLDDLADVCRSHRIPLMVSSQVSNLRSLPPFVSDFQPTITEEQRGQFSHMYSEGLSILKGGNADSALSVFRRAMELDSLRADLRYQMALCYDSLGRKGEARREYIAARDYDQLRFRTSADFNTAIARLGGQSGVIFVDIEKTFTEHSPDSIVGNNLILEHLHPNLHGYFLIAQRYAELMRATGLLASNREWSQADTVHQEELWDARSITDLDELAAKRRIEKLTSSWPFQQKASNTASTVPRNKEDEIVDQLVNGLLTWEEAHVSVAEYYTSTGNLVKAEAEYRTLMIRSPLNVSPYYRLAQILSRQRKFQEAKRVLLQTLPIEQNFLVYKMLGQITLDSEPAPNAVPQLEKAYSMSQTVDERTSSAYLLAVAYVRAGQAERAVAPLQNALALKPQFQEARTLLTRLTERPH